MKMHSKFERLARRAGFVFWQSDEMGTGIDWSCDYTHEFEAYSRLLVQECAKIAEAPAANILDHFKGK